MMFVDFTHLIFHTLFSALLHDVLVMKMFCVEYDCWSIFHFTPHFCVFSSVIEEGHIKYKGEAFHPYHFNCTDCG